MSKIKQIGNKETKFWLLDIIAIFSLVPMVVLAAVGMIYLVGAHAAEIYGIDCSVTTNPQECQSQLDQGWQIYEVMPYYLLGFVLFMMLKLTGALELILRRKTCIQCNGKKARYIFGKDNEEYVDCKSCGIYPVAKDI